MKLSLALGVATLSVVLVSPALAGDPAQENATPAVEEAQPQPTTEAMPSATDDMPQPMPEAMPAEEPAAADEPEEAEERICRRVRLDAASRRGTRVCLTREGWREFNQRR